MKHPLPQIKPMFAVSFHELSGKVFALKHQFGSDNSMTPGVNVSLDSVISTLNQMSDLSDGVTLIPKNVIIKTNNLVGWVIPSAKRTLLFKGLVKTKMDVPLPDMIAITNGINVYLFAITNADDITLDTHLYHAPMMNFFESGRMCLGSVKLPKSISFEALKDYEKAIFGTYNSHVNHSKTLKSSTESSGVDNADYMKFMRSLEKKDSFPLERLSETGMTLGSFLKKGVCNE